ncbi:MAG: hypothetical protein HKM95_14770 [Inquilinus sp.]|nr:hypothetical protein [Inquilinus sp.]
MDVFLFSALFLQAGCALLASRLGRPALWIEVVLMVPLAGSLVYAALEVDRYRRGRQGPVAPSRPEPADLDAALAGLSYRLWAGEPADRRRFLAEECLRRGRAADAVLLFRSCLDGRGSTDPAVIRGLRRAKAALGAVPAPAGGTVAALPANAELPLSA